jgi:hypothetical protein
MDPKTRKKIESILGIKGKTTPILQGEAWIPEEEIPSEEGEEGGWIPAYEEPLAEPAPQPYGEQPTYYQIPQQLYYLYPYYQQQVQQPYAYPVQPQQIQQPYPYQAQPAAYPPQYQYPAPQQPTYREEPAYEGEPWRPPVPLREAKKPSPVSPMERKLENLSKKLHQMKRLFRK